MNSEIFVKSSPTKLFFQCSIPAVITSVFGALYSIVDGIFVGKYLGENALAAVNLIMPTIMIVEAISNMIATGASVQMSILLGQNKREQASSVFSFSVFFILCFSCLVGILGFWFAKPFLMLLSPGANKQVLAFGIDYLQIYAVFAPLVPIFFAMDNYLRVCGKQQLSMGLNIISQIGNVVLDFILIAVLHQGVKAAAVASCIFIAAGSVISLLLFRGRRMDVFYTKKVISFKQFSQIIVNGMSEFFSSISASVTSIILNLFLLHYGGTTAVAAFSVVMYADSLIGMMSFGICDSLQPAISYCYGAKLYDRMKEIWKRILSAMVLLSILSFLFLFFIGPYTTKLFVQKNDIELLKTSITAIKLFSFSYLVGWIDTCFSSLFTALECPIRSLLISLFGTLLFPILFVTLLTAIYGLNGIWLTETVAAIASGIITLIMAKTLKIGGKALI